MRNGREDIALCTVLAAGYHNCIITQYSGFIPREKFNGIILLLSISWGEKIVNSRISIDSRE